MTQTPEADVVVLAGDINLGVKGLEWAARSFAQAPVVYMAGNPEFYRNSTPKLLKQLHAVAEVLGVHFLSNNSVVINDVRFLGTTLWTDFALLGQRDHSAETARNQLNDYRKIRVDPHYRKLRPSDTIGWHRNSKNWLNNELSSGFAGVTVVISHHAPSPKSIDPKHKFEDLNAAYASDLEDLKCAHEARLWFHGHTHHNVNYTIGQTRIITNQRGYSHTPCADFDPGLVICTNATDDQSKVGSKIKS